jgi:DNA-binding transcriptional ArsR family regulator
MDVKVKGIPAAFGGIDMPMNDKQLELVAVTFRVLADPLRLRLLQAMGAEERSVADLVAAIGTSQANVSKHLGILLRSGLVRRRKEGLFAYYAVADPSVFQICDVVCGNLKDRMARDLSQMTGGVERRPSGRGARKKK